MVDRLFSYGAPLGGYIDPVTGKLSLDIGGRPPPTPAPAPQKPIQSDVIGAPGLGQGQYPAPLAALRNWFDVPGAPVTGDPGYYDQPLGLAPMKVDPQGNETPAIPRAIREGAQYGLDMLASPFTGALPASFVGQTAMNALGQPANLSQPSLFLGKTAKQFPTKQAEMAKLMLKEGLDLPYIYKTTGVDPKGIKSTAKNPFFEVSDAAEAGVEYRPGGALNEVVESRMPTPNTWDYGDMEKRATDQGFGIGEEAIRRMLRRNIEDAGYQTTVGTMLPHPELFANHPEIAALPVHVGGRGQGASGTSLGQGYAGSYRHDKGIIEMSGDEAASLGRGKSTLLHEIQHYLQYKEGWPKGGNIAMMEQMSNAGSGATFSLKLRSWIRRNVPAGADPIPYLEKAMTGTANVASHPQVQQALDPKITDAMLRRYAKVGREGKKIEKQDPKAVGGTLYRRLAGEYQSRMAERRRDMPIEELRGYHPTDQARFVGEVPEQAQISVSSATGMLSGKKEPDQPNVPGNPFFEFGTPEAEPTTRGKMPQTEFERAGPNTKGMSDRMQAALGNTKLEKALTLLAEQGIEMGGRVWYDAEALRQAFMAQLGTEKGDFEFNRLIDFVGGTSPQNRVPTNVRAATYYYLRDRAIREGKKGFPKTMPQAYLEGGNWHADINPETMAVSPYGGHAAHSWQQHAQRIHRNEPYPLTSPKPPSFAANLKGNLAPYTADIHDFKQIGILSGDPRFLTSKALKSGVTPKTAGPNDWEGAPNLDRGEYIGAETLGKRIAKNVGLPPAHAQSSRWIAGGKMTGLKSDETKAFMDFFMDRITLTAKTRKIPPQEVLRRLIAGDEALLAETGLTPGMLDLLPKAQQPPTGDRLLQTMGSQS